jgi:threonylcarbamoyladenosine tRNA methylthiotransferase MtaB
MTQMRFAIATLGCKVNQYDSAIIESRLRAQGMERCEFTEAADVYIVNTCTVTDRADSESLRFARRARRLNPDARVIMTGCLAQASPDALAHAAEVDAVVGLGRPGDLERAASGAIGGRVMVSNLRKHRAPIELGAVALSGQTRAFLKVQEGCDQFCSFCIVPTSRGTSRSVAPRRVIDAIDELHARGFKEVTLSGVHLGGYGGDLEPAVELADLLAMIAERSPIRRIRVSSLDPEELSDRIIGILARGGAFCPHLHLPLQSGEDETLRRMRRRYDREYYRGRVERVLEAMPDAAIGTDVIVGFPGETEGEFEISSAFVREMAFMKLHVFRYSPRAGTAAARMPGQVPEEIKKERSAQLLALSDENAQRFFERFVGREVKVLWEQVSGASEAGFHNTGLTDNYLPVEMEAPTVLTNTITTVRLAATAGHALRAEAAPAVR